MHKNNKVDQARQTCCKKPLKLTKLCQTKSKTNKVDQPKPNKAKNYQS